MHYDAKLPTCTEGGYYAYDVCTRCNLSNRVDLPPLHQATLNVDSIVNYKVENDPKYPFIIENELITSINHINSTSSKYTIIAEREITLKLEYLVSSQWGNDYLSIKLNSTTIVSTSGGDTVAYKAINLDMKPGDKVIITYSKNSSGSSGNDCCYIRLLTPEIEKVISTDNTGTEQLVYLTEEILSQLTSCTENVYCEECGALVQAALGHDEQEHEAQAPTSTEAGWDAYVTCKREGCDYTTYVEIPPTGE
jgi:hypothetical protein